MSTKTLKPGFKLEIVDPGPADINKPLLEMARVLTITAEHAKEGFEREWRKCSDEHGHFQPSLFDDGKFYIVADNLAALIKAQSLYARALQEYVEGAA